MPTSAQEIESLSMDKRMSSIGVKIESQAVSGAGLLSLEAPLDG